MFIKVTPDIGEAEVTDHALYLRRREFLKVSAASMLLVGLDGLGAAAATDMADGEQPTALKHISGYNNYYEFATDKESPAELAQALRIRPWTISVEGEVRKPKTYDIDELLRLLPNEERIYRMRCVEGWSMVIPWNGLSLAALLKLAEPTGNAKFVEFQSLHDPQQMPGQRGTVLDWPYLEGLRIDEAMHPLAFLATGLYGDVLPKQNGAPIRLVVPWKYGFKSAKAIVRIRLTERQPQTTWMKAGPSAYGFYANVNPEVSHPRWSQAKERRIGEFFRRPTLPFNGYAEQVAQLYAGMDLQRNF